MLLQSTFLKSKFANSPVYKAFFIAILLIMVVFPDVILKNASIRMTDQLYPAYYGGKTLQPFYPIPKHTQWFGSYNDTGGAVFQSEPMMEFMKRTIKNGDSPYWNPYSAAGSLGPETLVDLKFSPLTIISALFGGNSLTYNMLTIFFFGVGVIFMYLTMHQILQLSSLASIGGSIFYLLNGYVVANFGSNVTQSYLYVPMCLYSVLSYCSIPNMYHFVILILTFAVMLLCTFLPTTIVSIIGIYIIAFSFLITRVREKSLTFKGAMYITGTQLAAGILAVLLLAFLYFPILENISSTNFFSLYTKRRYFPLAFPGAILSLFSPSHFFESYNAKELPAYDFIKNTCYHLGIIAIILAGCAFSLKQNRFTPFVVACSIGILFFFCRLFDAPILSNIIGIIPVVGKFGNQYWWMAIVLPIAVLTGFGIHNLQKGDAHISPAICLILIGIGSAFYVNATYGLNEPNIEFKKTVLAGLAVLTGAILVILFSIYYKKRKKFYQLGAILLVLGLLTELIIDSKIIRYERNEPFTEIPLPIEMVKKEIGLYRVLNLGGYGLYPELGSAYGVQEVTSLNEGGLPSYDNYFFKAFTLETSQQFCYDDAFLRGPFPTLLAVRDEPSKNSIDWQRVDLLGVKYVMIPSSFVNYKEQFLAQGLRIVFESLVTTVLENSTVLPRAFGIPLNDQSKNDLDIKLPDEFRKNIIPFDITHYSNAKVRIVGYASSQTLVVLSDNWHQNWTAKVNDKPAQIFRINGTFRGIIVPKGEFFIKMDYRPKTLSLAIIIMICTFVALLFMLIYRRKIDSYLRTKLSYWNIKQDEKSSV